MHAERNHSDARLHARDRACPYCGETLAMPAGAGAAENIACPSCRGLLDPLSLMATQNAMGPWQIRDQANPFTPGCSLRTLRTLVARGRVTRDSVLRGPTTRQFWRMAREIRGVSHLLGLCWSCEAQAKPTDALCSSCGASFSAPDDRNDLGLDPVKPLAPRASTTDEAADAATLAPSQDWAPIEAQPAPATPFAAMFGTPFGDAPGANRAEPAAVPTAPAAFAAPSPEPIRLQYGKPRTSVAAAVAVLAVGAGALAVGVGAALAERPSEASAGDATPVEVQEPAALQKAENPKFSDDAARAAPHEGALEQVGPSEADRERWATAYAAALAEAQADTIPALNRAVSALEKIRAEAPAEAWPGPIKADIARFEARLDELALAKFDDGF